MSIINSDFRLTGIATGLDTDQMVKDMMRVERIPLTRLEQQKQLAEWRQETYRSFTNDLRGFKEKYFDVTKQATYMLSENAYKVFSTDSTNSTYVTARGTSTAQAGDYTVKVLQLASADRAESAGTVSKPITGSVTDFILSGKTIKVTLDGITREIALSDYDDLADLVGDVDNGLQKLLDNAFGTGKIVVQENAGQLQLTTAGGAARLIMNSGSVEDGLAALGIDNGASNRISTSSTLADLANRLSAGLAFSGEGEVSFEINGAAFTFSEGDTLAKVMSTINNHTEANATLRYDEASDTFSLTAKQTGAGDNLQISETEGSFFAAIGIDSANPVTSEGMDAMAEIDGVLVTRSSNVFTVNGVEFTLKTQHAPEETGEVISLSQNVDTVYDAIKSFVDDYNALIENITATLSEKYDRNYYPLSEEEKQALSEDEVKRWEEKAKTGLLRNDATLEKIRFDMRNALIESVEGIGISLSSIGIASKTYQDNGKLTIDESKLKAALQEKPDEVMSLFKQQSSSVPYYSRTLSGTERTQRYQEQGLLYRISDMIEDQISILRDSGGRKGNLLEIAGMEGDSSAFSSRLAQNISNYDQRINELYDKLIIKEEGYYKQFSQLETYMNQMNSQMDWLYSQLNAMG